MLEQVPNFDDESLASLLKDLYGLEGEIAPLVPSKIKMLG